MKLNKIDYLCGETVLRYLIDEETEHISMLLIPKETLELVAKRREYANIPEMLRIGVNPRAWNIGSLVHVHLRHHPQTSGAGMTMKHSESTKLLKYKEQKVNDDNEKMVIKTIIQSEEGYKAEHIVTYNYGEKGFEVQTIFCNNSNRVLTLEMLSSFALDNISPFHSEDAPNSLVLHRFFGGWSLESKHHAEALEEINLERSWLCAFEEGERFGVVGSYPVKRYFPFCAIEDKAHGVTWGAKLVHNASWQMEVTRDLDCISLSGGVADMEFGQWFKDVPPKASFASPKAHIAAVKGDVFELAQSLTHMQHKYLNNLPQYEQELPIIFNEWCTSWGTPTHDKMLELANKLKYNIENNHIKYLVIDAGWTKTPKGSWGQGGNGDWIVNSDSFPYGIARTTEEIREMGFVPGIWFEFEVTTKGACVYEKEFDNMHLKRFGDVIYTSGFGSKRSFWDFRNPEVIKYLKDKFIKFLKDNNFGYLKVDYNGNIGVGCDGAESLGEGLRQHLEAVYNFFCTIKDEIPNIIIENCSSGGHRLEPLMTSITAVSSCTDAHECPEIPYIAANVQYMILPRQSLIWAVLQEEDDERRIEYILASTFLGRMCLSGNIYELSDAKWQIVNNAIDFYAAVVRIIKHGNSRIYGKRGINTRHPEGTQVVVRLSEIGDEALVVCHAFNNPNEEVVVKLPEGDWEVEKIFGKGYSFSILESNLVIGDLEEMSAFSLLLKRLNF